MTTASPTRAEQLHQAADDQVGELIQRLTSAGEQALALPCPGREKLGDGSIGAVAAHTADKYVRIGRFASALPAGREQHEPGRHGERHGAAEIELNALLAQLATARDALAAIGQLSDEQLDSVPPAGEMRFADGERTLEQVLAGLLRHQRHQVDALAAGLDIEPTAQAPG